MICAGRIAGHAFSLLPSLSGSPFRFARQRDHLTLSLDHFAPPSKRQPIATAEHPRCARDVSELGLSEHQLISIKSRPHNYHLARAFSGKTALRSLWPFSIVGPLLGLGRTDRL